MGFCFSFSTAAFAVRGDASTRYNPCEWGIFAMVRPFRFIIVHNCLWKMTLWLDLSSLLMDRRVNAISGACTAFLNVTWVRFDPLGSSRCRSPILTAFSVRPSAVVIVMIFPFSFILLHFLILIPFGPYSHSIPMSLSTRLSSFPLSMTHKPWGLLPLLFPHCLTLPGTALWLVLTPFHLEAVPPLYFPSVWLVMTRPLSFTGLPFALPSMYKYPVG